jgi:hypothetical protein
MLTQDVVFPTPPFWFENATILAILIEYNACARNTQYKYIN